MCGMKNSIVCIHITSMDLTYYCSTARAAFLDEIKPSVDEI
jgi:hypothetical protein